MISTFSWIKLGEGRIKQNQVKFIHKHRSDILKILQKYQVEELQVSFVKRRGRINILHSESPARFSYLRKKETHLDPTDRQWKHREWFKIKSNQSKELDVENWDQVMEAFDTWVSSL